MPLWCTSSDEPQISPNGIPQPHHRIVRIPPGESVVLNSAERAPYVLMLEVLHTDLDFNPVKRSNKDVLKKIITKELEKKGSSQRLATFNPGLTRDDSLPEPGSQPDGSTIPNETSLDLSGLPTIGEGIPMTPASPTLPSEPDEEIDLVEQLYGTDEAFRAKGTNLSESIVLPPAPKNRDLDIATWSRGTATLPNTPVIGTPQTPGFSGPFPGAEAVPATAVSHGENVLSLEEYSERMRTAAVMLAQLNASMTYETVSSSPIVGPGQSPNPASSRWFSTSKDPETSPGGVAEPKGPLHPSLGGSHVARQGTPTVRRKLSPVEAGAIRERIMKEMLALEEERMDRMRENREADRPVRIGTLREGGKTAEDENIIRRELNKADPSAVVFRESWAAKKVASIFAKAGACR